MCAAVGGTGEGSSLGVVKRNSKSGDDKESSAAVSGLSFETLSAPTYPPTKNFHRISAHAARIYGAAETRPQERVSDVMLMARRNNLDASCSLPSSYQEKLKRWASDVIKPLTSSNDPRRFLKWVSTTSALKSALVEFGILEEAVIGLDFEFYSKHSYEGFISVASISGFNGTIVVDCISQDFRGIQELLTKEIMENGSIIKAMCGSDSDTTRLVKDWKCNSVGIVDIQDLFKVWLSDDFEDCFNSSQQAVLHRLPQEQPKTKEAVTSYLIQNPNHGLEFLMDVTGIKSPKNVLATHADWGKRPLHTDLLKYSAADSNFALQIFCKIANKIGSMGLRSAARMTIERCINVGSQPSYDKAIKKKADLLESKVIAWREHIAKAYKDDKPSNVFPNDSVAILSKFLREYGHQNLEMLDKTLRSSGFNCWNNNAAKLLQIFVEDSSRMRDLEKIECHNCWTIGHNALICPVPRDLTKQVRRDAVNANPELKAKQNDRRAQNYIQKYGRNPPWWK